MKEVVLNEKTKEKVVSIFNAIKQAEAQIINIVETYLDAIDEKGEWKISQDFSKVIIQDEVQENKEETE